MTDRIVVTLDAEARDIVVEALRLDSTRRQRAATRAAAELHAEREAGRRDIRSGAVMVTNLLVDAAHIDQAAEAIAKAPIHRPGRVVETPELVAARERVREAAAAVPTPTAGDDEAGGDGGAPPASPPVAHDGPQVRTQGEALAETRAVIAELGLNLDGPVDDEDEVDDGRLPEDDPGDVELAGPLADLAPQEA